MRIIVISIVLALAGVAHAQRAPDMATLDRGDGISKFGVDGAFSSIDTPFYDAALRFEVYGQYVTHSGFGFYGAFPLAHTFGNEDDNPDTLANPATSIGKLPARRSLRSSKEPRRWSWVVPPRGGASRTPFDGRERPGQTNFFPQPGPRP